MLTRNALLLLARQSWLRGWVERSRLIRPLVRRFIAGSTLEDALKVCAKLNNEGISASLDHLGENVATLQDARGSVEAGLEAIEEIQRRKIRATLSIKLTQFGLDLSEHQCRSNVSTLVERGRSADLQVEVDMESSVYTDRTLAIVRDLADQYGNVRAVLQAYLYRTEKDLEGLCDRGIPVRLCKGAYLEPPEAAFPEKAQMDENYLRLMRRMLERTLERSSDPAFATHDASMIRDVSEYARKIGVGVDRFEFQMLYGIARDLQRSLVREGYRLRLYVPYGVAWYPYFMRRLAERPANVWFLARNLAGN